MIITDSLIRKMSWHKELDNIYNLASLHSWITQIDQLLKEFIVKYKSNTKIIQFLRNHLKEKNVPKEHHIISIVILYSFEYPTAEIIELANSCLYDKISKNDILFLKDHLFSGNFPVSPDLSYNITNRSFLSPKKAIKIAMKIDSVISKGNPINTVLYMSILLDSIDMNKENRAMVAFLLLRLDIELPKGLKERIYQYLWEYKDIIRELLEEEYGEYTNIDNLQSIKGKIADLQIIEKDEKDEKHLPDKKVTSIKAVETGINSIFQKKVNLKTNTISDTSNTKIPKMSDDNQLSAKQVAKTSKRKTGNNQSKEKNNKIQILNPGSVNTDKGTLKSGKSKARQNLNKSINTTSQLGKINQKLQEDTKKRDKWTEDNKRPQEIQMINTEIEKVGNDKELSKAITSEKEVGLKKIGNSWQIDLKGNKDILESILRGTDEKLLKLKYERKNGKGNVRKIFKNVKLENLSKKRKIIYAGLFILLLCILLLLILRNTGKGTALQSVLHKSTVKISKTEPQNIVSGNPMEKTVQKQVPNDFPINYTIKGNSLIWRVSAGDSISGFFYTLQDYKSRLSGTVLEKLSKMEWDEFFDNIVKNNPRRISYNLIYPGEIFILSLK